MAATIRLMLEVAEDDRTRRFEIESSVDYEDDDYEICRQVGVAMAQAVDACADYILPAAATMIGYLIPDNGHQAELAEAASKYLDTLAKLGPDGDA